MSINSVSLTGRLTKEPLVRKTPNGTSVLDFTLAVDKRNKQALQNRGESTAAFINCKAFGNGADLIGQYCSKGSQIGVEGHIDTHSYDDPNFAGRKVYVTEVIMDSLTFLDSKGQAEASEPEPSQKSFNIQSDDLPF